MILELYGAGCHCSVSSASRVRVIAQPTTADTAAGHPPSTGGVGHGPSYREQNLSDRFPTGATHGLKASATLAKGDKR